MTIDEAGFLMEANLQPLEQDLLVRRSLLKALRNRTATIGIVGLGYVGLPLALAYSRAGYPVLGIDLDGDKVECFNRGESYLQHFSSSALVDARCEAQLGGRRFEATTDFSAVAEVDAIIICVPTPLDAHREPDLSYITGAMDLLAPYFRPGQVLSLESTTYPGTTAEVLAPYIGLRQTLSLGHNFFLVYSPEREDPGNPDFNTSSIPKVVGADDPHSQTVGQALYDQVVEVVPVSSTRAAEMTKLLENIHRAVNIGLVNEMKIVAHAMGLDIHEIIDAAATKPFGFVPYRPGPGLGGHCIPIDPFYLTWKAREVGVQTKFIELAGEINSSMPEYVVTKVTEALNTQGRAVKGSQILVVGVAYKPNIDDVRETPAAPIMASLTFKGALVDYHDPHVPFFSHSVSRELCVQTEGVPWNDEVLANYDAIVILQAHRAVDFNLLLSVDEETVIVDTRGVVPRELPNVFPA